MAHLSSRLRNPLSFSILLLLALANITHVYAQNNDQTLIMMGSPIETCSTLSPEFCKLDTPLSASKNALFVLSSQVISTVKATWPTSNQAHLNATIKNLNRLAKTHTKALTKKQLLWAWRDIASKQMSELSQTEFDYVIDMLQVRQSDGEDKVINIDVKNSKTDQTWLTNTYKFIAASLKVNAKHPTLLLITASSRDPYAAANYYETVLSQLGVKAQWLALTPALAKAINEGQCEKLDEFRNKTLSLYNRKSVFPKRTKQEYTLCKQGIKNLTNKIANSDAVMLAGHSSDSLALDSSFLDSSGTLYPWASAVRDVPVLVAESNNVDFLASQQIVNTKQDAEQALSSTKVTIKPALHSVDFSLINTRFSEHDGTALLANALQSNNHLTGVGIDENTSLVVIKSSQDVLMTVLGEHGVVGLTKGDKKTQFDYSYWPTGSVFYNTKDGFSLSERSVKKALPAIKVPSLPVQRFNNILTGAKLRSLTQAMCLSQDNSAVGQQGGFLVSLETTENTHYYRLNTGASGCAIEQLKLTFSAIE